MGPSPPRPEDGDPPLPGCVAFDFGVEMAPLAALIPGTAVSEILECFNQIFEAMYGEIRWFPKKISTLPNVDRVFPFLPTSLDQQLFQQTFQKCALLIFQKVNEAGLIRNGEFLYFLVHRAGHSVWLMKG
jgi:hypothetical protein